MGRHGPLTSLALGRSPYDEVIQGGGEPDPRAPVQLYDERGRPVNPETARINRDVIRSHNEVMLVIGVAEPENAVLTDSQIESVQKRQLHEERIGQALRQIADVVEFAGVWGFNGMRQRIVVYKRFSEIPFHHLLKYHGHAPISHFYDGLPSFTLSTALSFPSQLTSHWFRGAVSYAQFHLVIFSFMQRLGLTSTSQWFPSWRFFLPGSESSPIFVPPLPSSITLQTSIQWLGRVAVGVAPCAGLFACAKILGFLEDRGAAYIYNRLPRPVNSFKRRTATASHYPAPITVYTDATEPEAGGNDGPIAVGDATQENVLLTPLGPGRGASSNQSSRGADEFGSDDEETEVVSATLISFDVEATEATDTSPGWCAELRPSVPESGGPPGNAASRVYRENTLTTLPARLAARLLASLPVRVLAERIEGPALRALVRAMLARRGLPTDSIRGLWSFSWTATGNLLGLEFMWFLLSFECWSALALVTRSYMIDAQECEEEKPEREP